MSIDLEQKAGEVIKKAFELIPDNWVAEGTVVWLNNTDEYVDVKTYDATDMIRWIPYQTQKIAPKQPVQLTARGSYIHIYVGNNQATYDCKKGKAYVFDGTSVHLKP